MKRIRQSCLLLSLFLWPSQVPAQQLTDVVPGVVVRTNPIYPPIAITARIQGDVRVKVTTDGASVVSAEADSGPSLLYQNTLDSVRTWKFASHTPAMFYLDFHFRLTSDKQIVFQESPGVVQVLAQPQTQLIVEYATIDLGKWKARLTTRTGSSRQLLALSSTGPWFRVVQTGARGVCVENESGSVKDEFIEFVLKRGTSGNQFKTMFVGRLKGNKIVGTFVDENGITGTWTAVRADSSAADAGFNPSGCPIRSEE